MSKPMMLYSPRPRVGQDCSKWKKMTQPNQSMSLKEIIRRFVKREALPQSKEGSYYEGEYDLEKLSKADLTEQHEVLEEIKADVKRKRAKVDEVRRPKGEPGPAPVPAPKVDDPPPPKG